MFARLVTLLIAATIPLFSSGAVAVDVHSAVLRVDYPSLVPISRYDRRPDDLGFAGAALADEDNSTTGSFLGHTYDTKTVATTPEEAESALDEILSTGVKLVVILARTEDLLRLTDQAAQSGALVFNATNADTALRSEQCRANLLHIAPSNAMNADAVAQFAMWKRWSDWFLLSGGNPEGQVIADAYRRSAVKFGAEIVEDRIFEDTGGSRRTDSGHVLVQKQIPLDTQNVDDHDVVIAADGTDFFAPYLPFHVWTPRSVMGSSGLRPVTMHGAHEAWGATQYQTRFEELNGRYVKPEDYNVWLALRVVGEAVTRSNTAAPDGVRDYALSDAFELAAFKGQKVTFR
ncbi:MAG: ABC transporter substrate-binding protein, partial [Pseudomonadota bacterium]